MNPHLHRTAKLSMGPFKVIIVGGSIAGMGLANMLEQCDIDFVLLEKHEIIAPDLGACLGLMANGLRIMEQLGCYDALHKISNPLNALDTYDGEGKPLILLKELGNWLLNLTGYKNENQDRRQVIDVLFQNLRDKSKIHTSKGVLKIESFSTYVKVETVDGTIYDGDIVVGADGVHSRVLDEMQRLSEIDTPNSRLFTRDEFDCNYRGLICIGITPKGLPLDNGIKVNKKGRSYMSVSGQNNRFYFNLFEKVERTTGSSIPRYAKDECDGVAAKYANDIVVPKAATGGDHHVTLGDLYKGKENAMLVSIHEGILKQCFYKRIILVGDSFHKSTPLLGQGGNNCLVSSAYLANQLNAITRDGKPNEAQIARAFQQYQDVRTPENAMIVSSGKQMQKMDAFEDAIVETIARYGLPSLSNHQLWNGMVQPNSSMWLLDYLPIPEPHDGMVLSKAEISIDPRQRSTMANIIWAVLFLAPVFLLYGRPMKNGGEGPVALDRYDLPFGFKLGHHEVEGLYFNIVVSAVLSLISIEASRASSGFTLLGSGLLHASLAFLLGLPIQLALYSIAFLRVTGTRAYYYPSVRVIHPATLILFVPALVIAYSPAVYYTFYSGDSSPSEMWRKSHAFLSITLFLLKKLTDRSPWTARWIPSNPTIDMFLKDTHVKYLTWLSCLLFVLQFASSRLMVSFLSRAMAVLLYNEASSMSRTSLEITCLEMGVLAFLVFAWWDIRRVNATSRSILGDLLLGVPLVFGANPTAALMLFWGIRETEWSKAYKKKPVERVKSGM